MLGQAVLTFVDGCWNAHGSFEGGKMMFPFEFRVPGMGNVSHDLARGCFDDVLLASW